MPKGHKLSDTDIKLKLAEGRNYKRLYHDLKRRFDVMAAEHKQCPKRIAELEDTVSTLKIQIAELQAMVFGKKRKPPSGTFAPMAPALEATPKPPRSNDSFRRPIPPVHAITAEELVPIPETCACGGTFKGITSHERYQEDIPLPELTPGYTPQVVTKYVVERGICTGCGKATSGQDLGGQTVRLGPNVRLLICHLVTLAGLSYSQVTNLLLSLYELTVSDGEITAIMSSQHQAWLPTYEQLKANVRASPAKHYDETPGASRRRTTPVMPG